MCSRLSGNRVRAGHDDGEQVVEVLSLPPREAADWLRVHGPTCADVVLLAEAMGLITAVRDGDD